MTCRGCYAETLTPDELDRFNAEPVTSTVYLCPRHEAAISQLVDLLDVNMIRVTRPSAPFRFPSA